MQSIQYHGVKEIVVGEKALPEAKSGEVLIRVAYADIDDRSEEHRICPRRQP